MVSIRKSGAVLLAVVMLPVVVMSSGDSSPARAVMAEVDRIDEEDPVRIAADIARQVAGGDLANLTDLVVATSEHSSDAIVSAGLAGYLDSCPRPGGASCRRTATVVTPADELAEVTAEVISDSGVPASRITLLGGPAAVSEEVRDQIASTAGWDGEGENPVRRVAGATRYDTAAAIAAHLVELAGQSGGDPLDDSYRTVVVATGANPADALAASALAYGGGHVVLLSSGGEVPPALDAAVAELDANCAILVGGSTALSDAVESHLERTVASTGRGACGAERIAGRDRYDTAARVADRVADEFGGPSSIVVTNPHGAGLAWTAAPLTRTRTSLLFTGDRELPEPTRDWITARPGIARVIVVGATRDIDRTVAAAVAESTFTRPLLPPPTALGPAPLSLSYATTAFDTTQTSQILGPTVTGGTGPFSFALTGGSLPVGITFDPTTGAFTGPGAWNFGAVVTVSAGTGHTCGVLADTTARCWGHNAAGRLGDGTQTSSLHPVTVTTGAGTPLSGIVDISAGSAHTCAVLADTTVRCWGNNYYGQLGDGTGTNNVYPVTVTTGAGTPLSAVTSISSGEWHTCAALVDATARCWGSNAGGQLGDGTQTQRTSSVTVTTGAGTPLGDIVQISSGGLHTCAVLVDTTARCWGYNSQGELGDGTTNLRVNPTTVTTGAGTPLSGIVQISASFGNANPSAPSSTSHTCAVLVDSSARCWGSNYGGQLGDGKTNLLAFPVTNPVIVLSSGNVQSGPSLSGVVQISSGWEFTCAVLVDFSARCWGFRAMVGRLGDGDMSNTSALNPLIVLSSGSVQSGPSLSAATRISSRFRHACSSVTDGGVRCWGQNGSNGNGGVGDGTYDNRANPVRVLASGTEASDPVPLGGSLAFVPGSVTVTLTDISTAATTSATVHLAASP